MCNSCMAVTDMHGVVMLSLTLVALSKVHM